MDLPWPQNVKEVQAFIGHCGYNCKFIYMYGIIDKLMYDLIIVFKWIDECKNSFAKLKQALIFSPILKEPNHCKIFHVHVNALLHAIGCILAQLRDNNMDFLFVAQEDSSIH